MTGTLKIHSDCVHTKILRDNRHVYVYIFIYIHMYMLRYTVRPIVSINALYI